MRDLLRWKRGGRLGGTLKRWFKLEVKAWLVEAVVAAGPSFTLLLFDDQPIPRRSSHPTPNFARFVEDKG